MIKSLLNSKYFYLVLATFLILSYWLLTVNTKELFFINETFPTGIKMIHDDFDIAAHFDRSAWYREGLIPYKEIFIEYPQLIAVLFAVPAFFAETVDQYISVYSFIMALTYIAFVWILIKLLILFKRPLYYTFAVFSPAFIYFTLNRFDILVVLLVAIALLLFLKNRYPWSAVILAASFFIKWYPILLVPVFFAYLLNKNRKDALRFGITFTAIFVVVFAASLVYFGPNVLLPYFWHAEKYYYPETIYYITLYLANWQNFSINSTVSLLGKMFTLVSIAVPALALYYYKKINDKNLIAILALVIWFFVFLLTARSPQFFMWLTPFLLLLSKNKFTFFILIAFDIFYYLYYPLAYASLSGSNEIIVVIGGTIINIFYLLIFLLLLSGKYNNREG